MSQEIIQVDAFTSEPYAGNPAAVCVMEGPADEEWMRHVAREMNLSETAFLYSIEGGYHLRWFTPRAEADLCGHGTLAAAHVLYTDGLVSVDNPVRFNTRSGWVSAEKVDDWIELDFPVNPLEPIKPPAELLEAIDVTPVFVGEYLKAYLVELDSDSTVRKLTPNLSLIENLPKPKVCVTAAESTGEADFVSRLFAPALGIPEDPVNGNSHTVLTPYWAEKLAKTEMLSEYASERGGLVRVRLAGDRVRIGGQAVTVLRGDLFY